MNDINFTIINLPGGADGTENIGDELRKEHKELDELFKDEYLAAPRKTAKDSPLDRMERDYGYEMTRDDEDCMQWTADNVTADDAGLNVRWQRVLTIRKANVGRDCWTVTFYHNREIKFMMHVLGGLSRARALAFDTLLAWHRSAKTKKIAR